jgi:hypothetical protein
MREMTLAVRDLVDVGVEMALQMGTGSPIKCRLRGTVTAITREGIEVRLLDDFKPLNGYPMRIALEVAPFVIEKINPPAVD